MVFMGCFWVVCADAGHEFYSSTDQIAQLYGKTKDLLKVFSQCIDAENVETMKSVLPNLLLSYSDSENPEEAVRDPVAAYRLLTQMRNDLLFIVKHTQLYQCEEYQNELDAMIPQLEDLDGAASGLIRLQEIYKLHPEDITEEMSLNADEAFNVGSVAYDEDKFQHAFLWFLYSLDRLTEYSTTTEEELLRFLSYSAYDFGSLSVAIYFSQQLLNLDPSNDEARVQLNRLLHLQSNPDIFTLNTESSNYEALCRGEVDERTSMRQRALSCRYSTGGGNPRLMYAPVKEEVEWDEPRIIRYHDIISDREIEILKNISRHQLAVFGIILNNFGHTQRKIITIFSVFFYAITLWKLVSVRGLQMLQDSPWKQLNHCLFRIMGLVEDLNRMLMHWRRRMTGLLHS
ncbi:hypothetical protein PO909_031370 [Leuciscus waleckii]